MAESEQRDEYLLTGVRESDVGSFRLLFEKYQPVLFRSIAGRLRDAELAHDIVQETFIRVWENRSNLKITLPFYPYIFRISLNLMTDSRRHDAARSKHADEAAKALSSADPPADEALGAKAMAEEIRKIVDEHLGERCRMIFLLSRMEGLSNSEISGMLQISRKTVENQITHALDVLRKRLGLKSPERGAPHHNP